MTGEYEEWQRVLSDAFLHPHHGPTVLFLDDSEIARLRPNSDDAARDLSDAVRSRLRLTADRAMFSSITASYRQWQRSSQADPPPVLPVIAITVLAATRMRSDSEARSTNYYLRLAQALVPDADAETIEALRNSLREGGAFLDVVEMWRGLHTWIDTQDGNFGTSTIRDHPHLLRIGYPLSQALVRQSDRATLTRFFDALHFPPGAAPNAYVILAALDIWTVAAQNRLSDSFMRALADLDVRPLLGSVVESHAHAWDGLVLTSDGKQRIAMRLGIDLDAWQARWLFPVLPAGPTMLTLSSPDGEPINLINTPEREYYSANGSPRVTPELVSSGIRCRGNEFTAEFPASPVVFLRPDPQTGAWSSAAGMIPFEDHLVAIVSAHAKEFEEVLGKAAANGWRLIPQRGAALLRGYALYQDVRFADGQAFQAALSCLSGLRRIGVTPAIIPRARLVRGLPLSTAISTTHYLTGGEPDLLLPSGPDPRIATVTLDGLREEIQANGFPLELRRFTTSAGRHIINADGQELVFTTLEEGPSPAQPIGTATLGWIGTAQMSGPEQPFAITGALVTSTATDATPVLARRGRDESWLLHDDGRTESVTEPPSPGFLSGTGVELYSPRFEINALRTARWLAQRRGPRWRLTEIGPPSPREYDLDVDILDAWKRACSNENGAQLWNLQITMAGGAA